ncbi:HU family DNA-binding protein [Ornithobacterium rhinotracheale]|uniref:DNA-binding protein, histone-like, putative n=2 Tax=Ornithobacterium rhinotracheale TaxID=28251 RepID=I4A219_ORNRL|nr:HU family DNA-binding protein [Ornithobacterium rhinotracheale]AFL98003.1 DNA-binding protein, histone-like, putative [Ornithobacterium rhinotracheale DSM 15997]AIP99787.1 DNA-binding protein [Ornithobacterium rhinotracheale ORT-UMN 88]KGB65995.1 DNA-binding protein [Ornithobacterium rhinotracheale H06-030791]MCK0193704.1 HU family DNA-binding protein [Ornithobacterium rhinotracheale]MCK0199333.1 HU family DNA-binding protein [Ornithobacterium rhinotracheale]
MAVKYNLAERKNPQKRQEPAKFYANAKADGEINLKEIAQEIAGGSTTVSDTDVLAVLNDLIKVAVRHMSNGEIVKLGDFGNFQITISSEGAETAEKFNPSMIKNNKVTFRPGEELRKMLKLVKYEKYSKK